MNILILILTGLGLNVFALYQKRIIDKGIVLGMALCAYTMAYYLVRIL